MTAARGLGAPSSTFAGSVLADTQDTASSRQAAASNLALAMIASWRFGDRGASQELPHSTPDKSSSSVMHVPNRGDEENLGDLSSVERERDITLSQPHSG